MHSNYLIKTEWINFRGGMDVMVTCCGSLYRIPKITFQGRPDNRPKWLPETGITPSRCYLKV